MKELEPIQPVEQWPNYEFSVDLDGRTFTYQLKYLERTDSWYLSLWTAEGTLLLAGARLGIDRNVLYRFSGDDWPDGALGLWDLENTGEECDWDDLGHRCRLVWVPTDELPEQELPDIKIKEVA